jgi:hypothetical protein
MADEQYRWLNRDAAERLLSGEPLEAVDPHVRARADRLAEALEALAAEAAPEPARDFELPGEEAALAAFRTARTARTARSGSAAHSGDGSGVAERGRGGRPHTTTASLAADAGLVHLGRPLGTPAGPGRRRGRRGRPVRFGLVAAVAAGMLGGVTVVAGGGALSAFPGGGPEPSATVSAGGSPGRPLMTPSPNTGKGDDRRGAWGGATPDPSPDATAKGGAPSGDGTGDTDEDKRSGAGGQGGESTRPWWKSLLSACRDIRDGKELDADRRRGLEDAAGARGKGQLKRYCEGVLAGGTGSPGGSGKAKRWGGTGAGGGTGTGTSDSGGRTGGGDEAARTGNGSGDDDDAHHGNGKGHRHGNGKGRHGNGNGNGKGDGSGHRHGNGNGKGGNKKGNQGGKGNKGGRGGSGHRGQFAAVTPIGFAAAPALTRATRTHPS